MRQIIKIGTSGWSYAHWDKVFYPEDLPSNQHLKFYSSFFDTVEINTTFYHLPLVTTVKNWHKQAPKDFIFSIKASRYITHLKRLLDSEEALHHFYSNMQLLKGKLGPILFQLPPSFSKNQSRLENFIELLNPNYRHVFEFRHPTWYEDEIYELLASKNIALCITDLNGELSPLEITSDFAYVRLHGPKRAYQGRYGIRKLRFWEKMIINWSEKQKKDVYIYFDNDEKSYAVKDALQLKDILKNEKKI